MRKSVFAIFAAVPYATLAAILVLVFAIFAPSASAGDSYWKKSEPFRTAKEAADFANALPAKQRPTVRFMSEWVEGVPMHSSYNVIYGPSAYFLRDGEEDLRWQYKENFASAEEAAGFANDNKAKPSFVPNSYWNPYKNSYATSFTVFYVPDNGWHGVGEDTLWEVLDKTFATAGEAAEYVNKTYSDDDSAIRFTATQFVSELFPAKQIYSSWRIVVLKIVNPGAFIRFHYGLQWRALEGKPNAVPPHIPPAIPFDAESALRETNNINAAAPRFVSVFDVYSPRSRVALFVLESKAGQ